MTEQQYAISEYPDVKDVYHRLGALVRQPMRPIRPERMQEYLNILRQNAPALRHLTRRLRSLSPVGCSTTWHSIIHSRSRWKKQTALIFGMRIPTDILTSFKRADPPFWEATMRLCVKK